MEPLAQMITQLQNLESNLLTVILDTVLNLSSLTDPSFLLVIDSPQGRYWTGKHSLRDDFLSNHLFSREDDVEYSKNTIMGQIDYQNREKRTRKRLSDPETIVCSKRQKSSLTDNFDGSKKPTDQKFNPFNVENDDPILVESYRFNNTYEEEGVLNDSIQHNSEESSMGLVAKFKTKVDAIVNESASHPFPDDDSFDQNNLENISKPYQKKKRYVDKEKIDAIVNESASHSYPNDDSFHQNHLSLENISKTYQKKKRYEDKEKIISSEIQIRNLAKEYQNDPEVLKDKSFNTVRSVKSFLAVEKEFEEVLGKYGCYDAPNDNELNHFRRMRMRGKKYWKAYVAAKKAQQNLT